MRPTPPANLVEQLQELGLATATQLGAARRGIGRLTDSAATFESVWIDALVRQRVLTLYQAATLSRGEGARLRLGPYVLLQPCSWLGRITAYQAREIGTGDEYRILTGQVESAGEATARSRLEQLVSQADLIAQCGMVPITMSGSQQGLVWGAHRGVGGLTGVEWLARYGRFPAPAMHSIARQLTAALSRLAASDVLPEFRAHGDLSPRELAIRPTGEGVLTAPGFRTAIGLLAPADETELSAAAFDSFSPRRVDRALCPNAADDRFALGTLCWQMLAGRSPWPMGDRSICLRSIKRNRMANIRFVNPDTPPPLADAIAVCTAADAAAQPASYEALEALLDPTASLPMARPRPRRVRLPARAWRDVLASLHPPRQVTVGLVSLATCAAVLFVLLFPTSEPPEPELPPPLRTRATGPSATGPTTVALERATAPPVLLPPPSRPPESPGEVAAASFRIDASPAKLAASLPNAGKELVLPSDRTLRLASLRLVAGQTVRAAEGERVRISVPREGLLVSVEDVRFANIDFVNETSATGPATEPAASPPSACLLRLGTYRTTFECCTFTNATGGKPGAVALDWETESLTNDDDLTLAQGHLIVRDCVFHDVAAGVRCQWSGALAVDFDNTLHLGPGPLVRLMRAARLDEPIAMKLTHCTLRDAAAMLEVRYDEFPNETGRLAVQAHDCVFALTPAGSLFLWRGMDAPDRMLANVDWSGAGAVIVPPGDVNRWFPPRGANVLVENAKARMAGLVTSEIGFAGPARHGSANSAAVRWQVPLRSPDPPGIDESRLPSP